MELLCIKEYLNLTCKQFLAYKTQSLFLLVYHAVIYGKFLIPPCFENHYVLGTVQVVYVLYLPCS